MVLVFNVAVDGVEQASWLLPRPVDVLEAQLEHTIEVLRVGADAAGHDEHRGNLLTCSPGPRSVGNQPSKPSLDDAVGGPEAPDGRPA